MNYHVHHRTTYKYAEAVAMSHNIAHLTPRDTQNQSVVASDLIIKPEPTICNSRLDFYGNRASFFTIQEQHEELQVSLASKVLVRKAPILKPALTHRWEVARTMIRSDLTPAGLEAIEFTYESQLVPVLPEVEEFARPSFRPGRPILEAILDLNTRIHKTFKYTPLVTTISTPLTEILQKRQGVCQDFAHLMIGCVRAMGLSARYVSGYLLTRRPPGQPRLIGADASHAWLSVYIAGNGWVDVDPTNNTVPGDEHITLAWGRDYSDVSPLRGVILGGGQQVLTVAVDVTPAD